MLREELFNILEKGIVKLIDVFLAKPFTFYTESDLHCQLYHILWDLGLNEGCRVEVLSQYSCIKSILQRAGIEDVETGNPR